MTKDRGAGTEDYRYGPWMLVTRRKPGQKMTNTSVISRDHSSHGLGQAVHGLKQEPNGEIRGWIDINRSVEVIGPLIVGREPNFGVKKVDKQPDI
nr:hypothetical protein CFP56_30353 [Quercus suber]